MEKIFCLIMAGGSGTRFLAAEPNDKTKTISEYCRRKFAASIDHSTFFRIYKT